MKLSDSVCLVLGRIFPQGCHDGGAKTAEEYVQSRYRHAPDIMNLFPPISLSGKTVLDAGCGLGNHTVYLREQGCSCVVGVDRDSNHIQAALQFRRSKGVTGVDFQRASLSELPFQDNSFDLVMMNDVVEHLASPLLKQAMAECKRVVKPDGVIYLYFPPWTSHDAHHLDGYVSIPWCHVLFSPETLVRVVEHMNPMPRMGQLSVVEQFLELNRITIKEFDRIVAEAGLRVLYKETRMVKGIKFFKRLPILRNYLTSRVVAVLAKDQSGKKSWTDRNLALTSDRHSRF